MWSNERSRLQQEQERLTLERNKALANCDQLMAQSASSSSQQDDMARQRRELLSEKDQLLTHQQILQTEYEKVMYKVHVCMLAFGKGSLNIHVHVYTSICRSLVRGMKCFNNFQSYNSRNMTLLENHNK